MNKRHSTKVKKIPTTATNSLRIIGGQWRSRKINFPSTEGLRPTPDRIRETLFNWLREDIIGARCLDLFSGSGALGFEALSREAGLVAFVDNNRQVVEQVTKNCELLNAQNALVFYSSAESWLKNPANQGILYDIVFLDPPFRLKLIEPICQLLSDYNFVHAGSKIYIEMEAEGQGATLPFHWQQIRSKQAGQISYSLYEAKPLAGEGQEGESPPNKLL